MLVFPLGEGEACAGRDAWSGRSCEGLEGGLGAGIALAGEVEGLLHTEGWNAGTGREFFCQFCKCSIWRDPGEKLAEGGIEKGGLGEVRTRGGGGEGGRSGSVVAFAREGEPAQEIRVGR